VILLDTLKQKLGCNSPWVEKGGVHWLDPGTLTLRELSMEMIACHARFITITAYQLPGNEGLRLEYHWDLSGLLLGFPFKVTDNCIDSIFDLTAAVDWIEREIHEEYSLEFTGRDYEPLLLREGDKLGVNLREIANVCKPETGAPGQEEVKQ
jgi:hypothetical protein